MAAQFSMAPRVRKLLQQGLEHHRSGRMGPAETCYRRSLKADPHCAPALHLLGLLAQQAGHYRESMRLIGNALALQPDDVDALNNLAESCLGAGELEEAARQYRRLLRLCPQSSKVHINFAKTQEQLGNFPAAADAYRRALELQPKSVEVHCQLAEMLRQLKALDEARNLLKRALTLEGSHAATYNELSMILTDQQAYAEALETLKLSFALKPDSAETAAALGYYFLRRQDPWAARDAYRRAVRLDPQSFSAHFRLGATLAMLGENPEAWKHYERAQSLRPTSPELKSYRGLLHLVEGSFALGWKEYEERASARQARQRYTQPQWNGDPLNGARIFLHAEQGLGDTLQAVRYVPLVAERGGQVILGVQSRLHRLLAGIEGAAKVICSGDTTPQFDWHCPLLSLPAAFAADLETIPARVPYVHPPAQQAAEWRERLRSNSLRVGLAWAGNAKHPHEFWRSIPLEQLAQLTEIEGATFYSLQMGPAAEALKQFPSSFRLVDLQGAQADFADTAAIVANLDLVITIDTSVAHLAGAMARPVWILLHQSADWRWLSGREDSPWYPTARLFRQTALGDWREVLARVGVELRALVEAPDGRKTLAGARIRNV